ncbi:hypothetical protein B566_EDAN005119 [Ephemera danica]|nr:hypothetical protein B566_EDAN005119 [Ephemera danica]
MRGGVQTRNTMKSLVLISLLAVVTAQTSTVSLKSNDICYSNSLEACGTNGIQLDKWNCTAKFSGYSKDETIGELLSSYVNLNIDYSFRYLLLATNYSTYSHNRPGFEKLYRGLADTAWEDAQHLISYITRRGGEVKFNGINTDNVSKKVASYLESNFLHKHSEKLRELSGHMTDVVNLINHANEHENRLAVFLFDEYLHSL